MWRGRISTDRPAWSFLGAQRAHWLGAVWGKLVKVLKMFKASKFQHQDVVAGKKPHIPDEKIWVWVKYG